MMNEAFGWVWITLGVVTGLGLGLRFRDDAFLGGYSSWARRLLRLGHISFFGLGLLNILFALGVERLRLPGGWIEAASIAFLVGGVTMPLCCLIAAWRREMGALFVVPVASLLLASSVTAWGMLGALHRDPIAVWGPRP
jgi:hypothetical protein